MLQVAILWFVVPQVWCVHVCVCVCVCVCSWLVGRLGGDGERSSSSSRSGGGGGIVVEVEEEAAAVACVCVRVRACARARVYVRVRVCVRARVCVVGGVFASHPMARTHQGGLYFVGLVCHCWPPNNPMHAAVLLPTMLIYRF